MYGVLVHLRGLDHIGVMNVGVKPTFGSELSKTFEVHILDFNDVIYGETVQCDVIFRVRGEKKFPSIEFLKHQIKADTLQVKQRFQHMGYVSSEHTASKLGQARYLNLPDLQFLIGATVNSESIKGFTIQLINGFMTQELKIFTLEEFTLLLFAICTGRK